MKYASEIMDARVFMGGECVGEHDCVSCGLGCCLTDDDVMNGSCLEGCDCVLSVLYTIAVQAAELRERLKQYEDTGLMPDEVEKIVDETLTLNERRQRLGLPAINDDISNFSSLRYSQGGDASG